MTFDPRHVTRFPPIGNVLELEGMTRVITPCSSNMASVPVILGAFYFNFLTFGGVSIISTLATYNLQTMQLLGLAFILSVLKLSACKKIRKYVIGHSPLGFFRTDVSKQ